MKTLIIRRVVTGPKGTFGALIFENVPFAVTLEPEWLDNRPMTKDEQGSCIPAGEYYCERVNSPRFGKTFEITNVPHRTHILFHKGNVEDNSDGCVLVAEKYGQLNGQSGILDSVGGFTEFLNLLSHDDKFRLVVVDDWKNAIL